MKQTLMLIRGLPGSGKSTVAKMLTEGNRLIHLETDMYFTHSDGTYHFDASKLGEAHQWCQNHTRRCLQQGYSVIVSNTFTRKSEMEFYIRLAEEMDAQIVVAVCQGNYGSIHGVPEETIERMRQRWES